MGELKGCGVAGPHLDGFARLGVQTDGEGGLLAQAFPAQAPLPQGWRDPTEEDLAAVEQQLKFTQLIGGKEFSLPMQVCQGAVQLDEKTWAPQGQFPGVFAYRFDLSRHAMCSPNFGGRGQALPGITLTPDEAAALIDLAPMEREDVCQMENAPGHYKVTSDPARLLFILRTLSDPNYKDPRISDARKQEILAALAQLPAVLAEARTVASLENQAAGARSAAEGVISGNRGADAAESAWWKMGLISLGATLLGVGGYAYITRRIMRQGVTDPKLSDFTIDLVEQERANLEKDRARYEIEGRDAEALEYLRALARPEYSNPLLEGESGAGKDKVVERAAQLIALKDPRVPKRFLDGKTRLLSVNPSAFQAIPGIVGDFAKRVRLLAGAMKAGHIVYFPELYDSMTAGSHSGGASESLASQLKPILTDPSSRFSGSTATGNYERLMRMFWEMRRRFVKIHIANLSEGKIREIIAKRVAPWYAGHYGVNLGEGVVEAAMSKGAECYTAIDGVAPVDAAKQALLDGIERAMANAILEGNAGTVMVTAQDVDTAVTEKFSPVANGEGVVPEAGVVPALHMEEVIPGQVCEPSLEGRIAAVEQRIGADAGLAEYVGRMRADLATDIGRVRAEAVLYLLEDPAFSENPRALLEGAYRASPPPDAASRSSGALAAEGAVRAHASVLPAEVMREAMVGARPGATAEIAVRAARETLPRVEARPVEPIMGKVK